MARNRIGRLHETHLQWQGFVFPQRQGGEREALTGAQAHMQGLEPLRSPQFKRSPKRDRGAGSGHLRMTEDDGVGAFSPQQEVDVEAHSVGSNVVEG